MQKLPNIIVPEFTVTLPLSRKAIRARRFLVKEEKILLMAIENFNGQEAGDVRAMLDAIFQVLQNCVLTSNVDVYELPTLDVEYLFLELRKKSIGEVIDNIIVKHECGHANIVKVNLEAAKIITPEGHTNKIDLGNGIGLVMKYPSLYTSFDLILENISQTESYYDLLISSIDKIYDKDDFADASKFTKEEWKGWLETLTPENFKAINQFFETIPHIVTNIKYKCEKCGEEASKEVRGTTNFFT